MSGIDTSPQTVIGLAGHVDHGKTTLVKALTGMMTARPHEQALGMTQDLGFAHFEDEQGRTIGIIDVPGHERYVRNMVAGVWHINILLLVISATEGCMPMTFAHMRLARAMGVKDIVVCINKSDLVSEQVLADVEESALESIMDVTGIVPEVVCVSALTGHNIETLRQTLLDMVARVEPSDVMPGDASTPLLYVDRVFVANGVGTIVTGTLAQGTVSVGDKLFSPNGGTTGAVRSIQCYHQQVHDVTATCRVALNIKGLSRKQVQRGDLLCAPSAPVTMTDSCIVRLDDRYSDASLTRSMEVEVAVGTWHGLAQCIPLPNTRLARLLFRQPRPMFFGQRLAIIQSSGHGLLAQADVVWTSFIAKARKRAIYQALSDLPPVLTANAQLDMLLQLQGYYSVALLCGEPATQGVVEGQYVFDPQWLAEAQARIIQQLSEGRAMGSGELSSSLQMESDIVQVLTQQLKQQDRIFYSYAKWQLGSGQSEDELPEVAQTILRLAREAGAAGLELNKVSLGQDKKWLRQLAHQKYITAIDEQIYFDMGVYQALVHQAIGANQPHDRVTLQEIKQRVDLSRKYLIPFVNRMEKDGWLRRDDEVRIILKSASE